MRSGKKTIFCINLHDIWRESLHGIWHIFHLRERGKGAVRRSIILLCGPFVEIIGAIISVIKSSQRKIASVVNLKSAVITMQQQSTAAAENFAKLARRGQEIFVEGSLRQDRWEDDEGKKRSRLYVNVLSWQFTQCKSEETVAKTPANGLARRR
jgi:hypothetical protein